MKRTFICLILFLTTQTFAQQSNNHFNVHIQTVKGDLNKDGIDDEVIVTQDTLNAEKPYRLQIFFYQKDGSKKLIVTTDKAIESEASAFGYNKSFNEGIQIYNGVLSIYEQLLRGNYTHIFRYQNGNFEMIGYHETNADGLGKMYEIDFNLSTGVRIEKVENYENGKVLSNKKTKMLIRPLPKLQDFVPYEDDRY